MWYVSTADANTYLETSGEDSIVSILVDQASKLIDRYCGTNFESSTQTNERHQYNWAWPYYLKYPPRWTAPLTHVYWSSVSYTEWTDYILRGRQLTFVSNIALNYNTTFNFITFTYTSGYTAIPDDIKDACYMIVSWLYNLRKAMWTSQLTQGDLSVSFTSGLFGWDSEKYNSVKMLLSKYKITNVIS